MNMLLAIALGGALGALARHKVGSLAMHWLGSGFPYGTLAVNLAGSFLLGVLTGGLAFRFNLPLEARAFLMVGFCGAFTTFSTFALDFALLTERGNLMLAGLYVAISVAGAILAMFGGLAVMRTIFA
ncbi:MAG: fluoride efflux transporter CrcB [Nisaea sp.]|uniref:fluoride efflux transporter CrcB n=1 Tax=Nisaea sp. TaxID=2024842 RepID=UPI001B01101F|nr:fluoride efflux transporter CrcB [Nisaea sp.]MBO6561752.1 fluoride efflux transporter CrcB [Nisaea sp.]